MALGIVLKGQAYPKWSDVIVKAFPKMQLPMFGNTKTLCQDEREKEREREFVFQW